VRIEIAFVKFQGISLRGRLIIVLRIYYWLLRLCLRRFQYATKSNINTMRHIFMKMQEELVWPAMKHEHRHWSLCGRLWRWQFVLH